MKRKDYFDKYISTIFEFNAVFSEARYKVEFNTFDRNFFPFLPNEKNAKILEIGFGTGFCLKYLADKGYQPLGIELSGEEVDFVKEHVYKNVLQVENTEEFLTAHQKTYDFIIMLDVLEHIPKSETIEFLKCIRAALKDGGTFVARVPNGSNPFNVQEIVVDFTHEFIFSTKSLLQVNKLAGFTETTVYPFKEENISWHSKITNITAPVFHWLLKILIGLNRNYMDPTSYYTRNIFCVCRK